MHKYKHNHKLIYANEIDNCQIGFNRWYQKHGSRLQTKIKTSYHKRGCPSFLKTVTSIKMMHQVTSLTISILHV